MATDHYAVFGHPIGHSQSPRIHSLFAGQTGQTMSYAAVDVPAGQFDEALTRFIADGGKGLNCTVPLKELAWHRADIKSGRAQRAGAVNTLQLGKNGLLYGDNTDGVGLLRDLTENLAIQLAGLDVLVLGAGGAVRGVLEPLLAAQPRQLAVANRTVVKAELLAREFSGLGSVEALELAALEGRRFDLILNATAASLSGELPALPAGLLRRGGVCYDLAYGAQPTPFVLWGRAQEARLSVDGIGMLVEQAAEAFWLWRGVRPATHPVIEALESARAEGV